MNIDAAPLCPILSLPAPADELLYLFSQLVSWLQVDVSPLKMQSEIGPGWDRVECMASLECSSDVVVLRRLARGSRGPPDAGCHPMQGPTRCRADHTWQ